MICQASRLVRVLLLLLAVSVAQQPSKNTWRFAVSGDSRNCGDVVMPAFAKSVHAHKADFYWHLGDFRIGYDVDEDMQQSGNKLSITEYQKTAWDDFITHQVELQPDHGSFGNWEP